MGYRSGSLVENGLTAIMTAMSWDMHLNGKISKDSPSNRYFQSYDIRNCVNFDQCQKCRGYLSRLFLRRFYLH